MAHHGDTALGGLPEALKRIFEQQLVGATGTWSEGQFGPGDAGDIQFAIGAKAGRVMLDFGAPVFWMSMHPDQAAQIAQHILAAANQAKAQAQLGVG